MYIIFNFVKNFLHVCSLILFLGVRNIPEEIWSISKRCPPLPRPTPSFNYRSMPRPWEPNYCSLHLDIEVEGTIFLPSVFRKNTIFHSFRSNVGIRPASGIRPTCLCRCPPLVLILYCERFFKKIDYKLKNKSGFIESCRKIKILIRKI